MNETITSRNGYVELLRFFACISIAVYHFECIYLGLGKSYFEYLYVFVECFFVISGFFVALKAANTDGDNTYASIGYVKGQFKKLYPLFLISFLITFVIVNFINNTRNWLYLLWQSKWEWSLGVILGIDNNITIYNRGGAAHYISALLVVSFLLFFIIQKDKEIFIHIIAPVIVVMGIGYMLNNYDAIGIWISEDAYIQPGIIRGLIDMTVGAWCALVVLPYFKREKQIKKSICIVSSIFLLLLLFVGREYLDNRNVVLYIFVFGILVAALFSVKNEANKIALELGKMTYPIFLFHYCVIVMLKKYIGWLGYRDGLILYFICLMSVGTVTILIRKAADFWRKK